MPSAASCFSNPITAARDFITKDREYREAWDVHTWGLFGLDCVVGRVFACSQLGILLSYVTPHADVTRFVGYIIGTQETVGWRYFPNTNCKPDADDFGLALQLLSIGKMAAFFDQHFISVVQNHPEPDGRVCTWLDHPAHKSEPRDYCVAVAANFYIGVVMAFKEDEDNWLKSWPRGYYSSYFQRAMRYLFSQRTENGWRGYWYQNYYHDTWLVARALNQLDSVAMDDKMTGAKINMLRECARSWSNVDVFHSQTPAPLINIQDLAWIILFLKEVKQEVPIEYLQAILEAQRPDGGWDALPFYKTPFKNDVTFFKSRLLTTAAAAAALSLCREQL
jgi:hypothetical protein